MSKTTVDCEVAAILFKQYTARGTEKDALVVFAAPAKVLAAWAGVPRKGWRLRMFYQRWVTPTRERELRDFWDRAGNPNREKGQDFILGPTAITLAFQEPVRLKEGKLHLYYDRPIDFQEDPTHNLHRLAELIRPRVDARLSTDQRSAVEAFRQSPLVTLPDVAHDYVLEFALQLEQMIANPQWFIDENAIEEDGIREMIQAMEALYRPAIVVDGQHRLLGAADSSVDVWLPVVGMPDCTWSEQIYQFIVINEKAQKVDSALLTDIFGSSLTRDEQFTIRDRLARAKVDVEARIASVIANREPASPFYQMVRIPLGGDGAPNPGAFITDNTIRLLIEGSTRHARGWRSDEEFYETFVKPTIPDSLVWESWTEGRWREYWFAFWHTVANYYNEQAAKLKEEPLWVRDRQTNLTKAVTLRILQKLFMDVMQERLEEIEKTRDVFVGALGEEAAAAIVEKQKQERALPGDLDRFSALVRKEFLDLIPVRIFLTPWVKSLDDDEGRGELYDEFAKALNRVRNGQIYRISNKAIFNVAGEPEGN